MWTFFCNSSGTWLRFKRLPPTSSGKKKRLKWNRVTSGTHLNLLCVVLQKQHKGDVGGGREKREWKRERHYSAEQRQVEDYRWLALCRGAWACFQAHFSVIFSLYPRARSPRRVRMRHGAMWWMKRGRPKRYGHAGSKKTWPASWRGDW